MWPKLVLVVAVLVYAGLAFAGKWGVLPKRVRKPGRIDSYVLITENAESEIEVVLRGLLAKSQWTNEPIFVVVIDVQSSDLTLDILRHFTHPSLVMETLSAQDQREALQVARKMARRRGHRGERAPILRLGTHPIERHTRAQ